MENTEPTASVPETVECLKDGTVLIAGGGPVGLVLATTLAFYGVSSVVLERNETTTRWPKMDLTNARSMEIFRKLGLADDLRAQGLNEEENLTAWNHDSVDNYRQKIATQNDGTLPLEPYQRLSQSVFEAWLKKLSDKNELIDLRFGSKVESVLETDAATSVIVTDIKTDKKRKIVSRCIAACDGASSKLRRGLGIPLDGGPVPTFTLLIHFKSKDLTRLHRQGLFWHIFFIGEGTFHGAIIAQDEKDTWTTHLSLPLDTDPDTIDSYEAVYKVLGGTGLSYKIKIDEILVRSTYRPSIAVARKYISPKGTILLAGDAAHQNIPTGGYGMNMGLGDAFDLGWKIAMFVKGHGGPALLQSYEDDRRPVALNTIERSGVHTQVHIKGAGLMTVPYSELNSDAGKEAKKRVHEHYQENDGENTDLGIEMDYRYKSSICIADPTMDEPEWKPSVYTPSTFPGSRAPHVFLEDGSAIFDHFGKYFSLIDFRTEDETQSNAELLLDSAAKKNFPLKHVKLQNENHARKIWGNVPLVVVRPDGHVAWRGSAVNAASAVEIIDRIAGITEEAQTSVQHVNNLSKMFSGTVGVTVQDTKYELDKMGAFQA
ncbi:hypothetical protein ACEPPN_013167 [Leptodophora sp. 'Broadleaf-Isolate-01']